MAYASISPSPCPYPYQSAIVGVNTYYLDSGYYSGSAHFQCVLAHEIGHVLGLAHENDNGPTVLMYENDMSYIECGIYTFTYWDDIPGIQQLYGG